jgi:hypothetical protein
VQLYLSPTTAGTWTTTKPSAPQHLVYVGVVIRSHPTQGTILVAVQNGYELGEIHDVALSSEANNDLLAYESSTDLWKNKTFSALGLLTSSAAASTYAPIASPTFTGTVTIPAGASISGFAPLASPAFTGTPSLPTGTTGVTQSPGDNTTALATTAFVTAAVPAFATAAQAIGLSSTTLALNPQSFNFALSNGMTQRLDFINTTAISGSAATTFLSGYREAYTTTTLSAGRAGFFLGGQAGTTYSTFGSKSDQIKLNFSKKIWMSGRFGGTPISGYLGDANGMMLITLGGYTSFTTGNMTSRGIGLRKAGGVSSNIELIVHNGTTFTTVATTVTLAFKQMADYIIYSDGAGNVQLYLNGVLAASTSAGPTGLTADFGGVYREQVEQTASATTRYAIHSFGGMLIQER